MSDNSEMPSEPIMPSENTGNGLVVYNSVPDPGQLPTLSEKHVEFQVPPQDGILVESPAVNGNNIMSYRVCEGQEVGPFFASEQDRDLPGPPVGVFVPPLARNNAVTTGTLENCVWDATTSGDVLAHKSHGPSQVGLNTLPEQHNVFQGHPQDGMELPSLAESPVALDHTAINELYREWREEVLEVSDAPDPKPQPLYSVKTSCNFGENILDMTKATREIRQKMEYVTKQHVHTRNHLRQLSKEQSDDMEKQLQDLARNKGCDGKPFFQVWTYWAKVKGCDGKPFFQERTFPEGFPGRLERWSTIPENIMIQGWENPKTHNMVTKLAKKFFDGKALKRLGSARVREFKQWHKAAFKYMKVHGFTKVEKFNFKKFETWMADSSSPSYEDEVIHYYYAVNPKWDPATYLNLETPTLETPRTCFYINDPEFCFCESSEKGMGKLNITHAEARVDEKSTGRADQELAVGTSKRKGSRGRNSSDKTTKKPKKAPFFFVFSRVGIEGTTGTAQISTTNPMETLKQLKRRCCMIARTRTVFTCTPAQRESYEKGKMEWEVTIGRDWTEAYTSLKDRTAEEIVLGLQSLQAGERPKFPIQIKFELVEIRKSENDEFICDSD